MMYSSEIAPSRHLATVTKMHAALGVIAEHVHDDVVRVQVSEQIPVGAVPSLEVNLLEQVNGGFLMSGHAMLASCGLRRSPPG